MIHHPDGSIQIPIDVCWDIAIGLVLCVGGLIQALRWLNKEE